MSERDLNTLLRDHLADEPPFARSSIDAIRVSRRRTRRRAVLGGVGTLALATAAMVTAPSMMDLTGDDEPGAAQESAPLDVSGPIQHRIEAVATDELDAAAGGLGDPTWVVVDVSGTPRPPGDPRTQSYRAQYHPAGTPQVDVDVSGVDVSQTAEVPPCAPGAVAEGLMVSCQSETLADGTTVTTLQSARRGLTSTSQRVPKVGWAIRHPDQVSWVRVVVAQSPDGTVVGATEYADAPTPDAVDWKISVDALRAVATNPSLLDYGDLAHAPYPYGTTVTTP